MKSFLLHSVASAALILSAVGASAQLIQTTFNFDNALSGAAANSFATPAISFHQAYYIPSKDSFGSPIGGTEHWDVDTANDLLFPVTVENPLGYGRGSAPSGSNALQALWQPVLVKFDHPYFLQAFSTVLDNDTYGLAEKISFVTASGTLSQLPIDQRRPGYLASTWNIGEISGIVLPSGAFYDNLSVTLVAVPEPSTYGLLAAGGCASLVGVRRCRARRPSAA